MNKELIKFKWRDLNSIDYDIIIGEENCSIEVYREGNGRWTTEEDSVLNIVIKSNKVQKNFEKCYQLHKREEKLKRICY